MSSRKEKELLTPYRIVVVIFIEKYGSLYPNYWGLEPVHDLTLHSHIHLPNMTSKERKGVCILISKLIQGSDISLSEFMNSLEKYSIYEKHISIFDDALQKIYKNGIEGLLSLFDSVEKFCVQDQARSEKFPCTWTSLIGLHLRQLNLSFRRLSFSHVISLYQKFCNYYTVCFKNSPSMLERSHASKLDSKTMKSSFDVVNDDTDNRDVDMDQISMEESTSNQEMTSPPERKKDDLQLRFSLPQTHNRSELTSKYLNIATRQQAEVFIQEQITALLQQDPSAIPPAQLQEIIIVMLRNCPDLGKAHFLRYLNYLRVKEQTGAIQSLVRAYDSKLMIYKDLNRSEEVTRTFRYAALNMAALQAQFGHKELGLISLEEAIRLAQESNDHVCLQYALAWLYSLSSDNKAALMKRSFIRSSEMNLPYLSWLSLLNYTKELAKTKVPPAKLLRRLLYSSAPTNQQRGSSSTGIEGGLASQTGLWAVQAGLWALWGNLPITAVCSQMVLRISTKSCRGIHAPATSNPVCAALCNMALILYNVGDFNLSGELLTHAQEQFPAPLEHCKLWMLTKCYVSFYDALRQGLWSQAKTLAVNMATVHPLYSKLLEAELLVAKGEFSKALEVAESLTKNDNKEIYLEIEVLEPEMLVKILLVQSEALAGGNNLGGSLSTLVRAISVAKDHHMAYLAALANLQMASVQMHIGLLKEANYSFKRGLDVILSGGGIYDQARAKLLQAKLQVRSALKSDYVEKFGCAADSLEEVQKLFCQMKAHSRQRETVYLKARFYQECGQMEERNRSALEFRKLELNHPDQPLVPNTSVF